MIGRKSKKIEEYQNSLMKQHYVEVENMCRTMRGWKHDWHNQLQINTVIKTGNTMVDAILNSKISLMKSHQIEAEAEAKVPAALSVPDVDLCIVIGNLLDNAMEACARLEEGSRFVHMCIIMTCCMYCKGIPDRKKGMYG